MRLANNFTQVKLEDIDIGDTTYHLLPWAEEPESNLKNSVRQFGIFHPPLLLHSKEKYKVITGRKRLLALEYHHEEKIVCNLVPQNMEQKSIYTLLLEEILARRSLSPVEQIIFFEKFMQVASEQDAIPLLKKIGQKPHLYFLRDLLKLRLLDHEVLLALHRGSIQIKNAAKLLQLDNSDQKLIATLISELKLGGSKQRKLIELCTELIMRNNKSKSLEQILVQCPFYITKKDSKNIPQQVAGILSWLEKRCSPQAHKRESDLKKIIASLDLPQNMRVNHTQSFEDDAITLSVRFDDWQQFQTALQKIRQIIQPDK